MTKNLALIPIDLDGTPRGHVGALSDVARDVLRATADFYALAGFNEPWIGYLAIADGTPVGSCGYKSKPVAGKVEIAYFTFPGHEGLGHASAMAAELIAIARGHAPSVAVTAQTLPERNASHRILEKLGFRNTGTIDHPEDGTVFEWTLDENPRPLAS